MDTAEEYSRRIRGRMRKPSRDVAPFRWFGGKGAFTAWIKQHIPASTTYVEPYAGAAGMFWRLPPAKIEVLNDLHSEIVNLFRVLQDREQFEELAHRLTWTPYSREEFDKSVSWPCVSQVDRAWAFFVRQSQSFSGFGEHWSRTKADSRNARSWSVKSTSLDLWHERLSGVQIENKCAIECIKYWDSKDTVFYLDPPYVLGTRKSGTYKHEVDDEHYRQLVQLLLTIQGQAVLSGYDHELYKPLVDAGWKVERKAVKCHTAKANGTPKANREEVLWIKHHD